MVGADGFECKSCSYEYTASAGDPSQGAAAGPAFMELPEEWCCPTCGAAKAQFFSKGQVIAGFTQNQQYGLGGNSMRCACLLALAFCPTPAWERGSERG